MLRDFLAAVEEAEGAITRERLAALLAARRLDEVVRILTEAWDDVAKRWRVRVATRSLDALSAGGDIAASGLRLEVAIAFDRANPAAVAFARERAAVLVTHVGRDLRQAIRETVTRSFTDQVDVWRTSRAIRQGLGLRPDQARALANYRAELEALAGAVKPVTRVTRMRRLSSKGLTPERIDAWVEKYRQWLLRQRADTIARTEIITASNMGQVELWRQAVADGQLPAGAMKTWLTVDDDRLCPRCLAMDKQTVPIAAPFVEPGTGVEVMAPALHPNCRCTCALADIPLTGVPRAAA